MTSAALAQPARQPKLKVHQLELKRRGTPDTMAVHRFVRIGMPAGWTGELEDRNRTLRLYGPEGEGKMLVAVALHPSELDSYFAELKRSHPSTKPTQPQQMNLPGLRPHMNERAIRFAVTGGEVGEVALIQKSDTFILVVTMVDPNAWPRLKRVLPKAYATIDVRDAKKGRDRSHQRSPRAHSIVRLTGCSGQPSVRTVVNLASRLFFAVSLASGAAGCSGVATGLVADALSGSGNSYAKDNDPELIEVSAPFGLKTMEAVLESQPEHRGLLTALSAGYVQYAYGFIAEKAHVIEEDDYDASLVLKLRAKNLYFRARDYGLQGLSVEHDGFAERLRSDPTAALTDMTKDDVPLLYWTAAAWSLGISAAGLDPELVADLPLAGQLAQRALELDETWNDGALHEFMVSYEAARPGGDLAAAKATHFERALALNGGRRAGSYRRLRRSRPKTAGREAF